jgi:hypothetical protein
MAPVYADHPFPLIRSPISLMGKEKTVWCYTYVTIPSEEANISQPDVFDICASEMSWVHNMMMCVANRNSRPPFSAYN